MHTVLRNNTSHHVGCIRQYLYWAYKGFILCFMFSSILQMTYKNEK